MGRPAPPRRRFSLWFLAVLGAFFVKIAIFKLFSDRIHIIGEGFSRKQFLHQLKQKGISRNDRSFRNISFKKAGNILIIFYKALCVSKQTDFFNLTFKQLGIQILNCFFQSFQKHKRFSSSSRTFHKIIAVKLNLINNFFLLIR